MEKQLREKLVDKGQTELVERLDREAAADKAIEAYRIKAWCGEEGDERSSASGESSDRVLLVNRLNDRDPEVRKLDEYDYSSGLSTDEDMMVLEESEQQSLDKLRAEFDKTVTEQDEIEFFKKRKALLTKAQAIKQLTPEENKLMWESIYSDVPDEYQFVINSGTEK